MKKTKLLSILISIVILPVFQIPVYAEEVEEIVDVAENAEVSKNWNYYSNLDDYSVYCEYCNEHGYEIQDKLPTRGELPDYNYLHYGIKSGSTLKYADFTFILSNSLSEEKYYDVRYNMNYFGFPEEWCKIEEQNDDYYTPSSIEILNFGGSICIELQPTEYTQKLEDNVINAYRIDLTVRNSEFGKEYPIIYTEISNSKPLDQYQTGDVDGNKIVDIIDVLVLNQYLVGIYQPSDAGIDAADVDHNGKVEDADSMKILKSIVGLETLE
jgi:hypothetical protein